MDKNGQYKIIKQEEIVCIRHPIFYKSLVYIPLSIWEQSLKKDVDINTSIHTTTEQYTANRLWYDQNLFTS